MILRKNAVEGLILSLPLGYNATASFVAENPCNRPFGELPWGGGVVATAPAADRRGTVRVLVR
jgi:hypothetical protein